MVTCNKWSLFWASWASDRERRKKLGDPNFLRNLWPLVYDRLRSLPKKSDHLSLHVTNCFLLLRRGLGKATKAILATRQHAAVDETARARASDHNGNFLLLITIVLWRSDQPQGVARSKKGSDQWFQWFQLLVDDLFFYPSLVHLLLPNSPFVDVYSINTLRNQQEFCRSWQIILRKKKKILYL